MLSDRILKLPGGARPGFRVRCRSIVSPLGLMLIAATVVTSTWADSSTHRDQRRQELRQALQAQRQPEPGHPQGDSTVHNADPARRLTPEELLALRRQLQEMRTQRPAGSESPARNKH